MTSTNLNESTSDFVKKLTRINLSPFVRIYCIVAAKASELEEAKL